jgi:hypothetical protein
MLAALHSYTHPTWGSDFGVLGHLWSQIDVIYVMVEADGHLRLLPTSILNIYRVFEHIDMLSLGYASEEQISDHVQYTVLFDRLFLFCSNKHLNVTMNLIKTKN